VEDRVSDRRTEATEIVLGRVLTIGTRISTALLALGLGAVVAGAWGPGGRLLTAGLLVLMATPIARVAVSTVEFARGREWWFVLATGFVLALLAGSLIVAIRG
jgi:uncharacterized membrane protein